MAEQSQDPIPHRVSRALAQEAISRLDAASIISHSGERGRAREEAISDFVRSLIPSGFGIGTGFVIDSTGEQSRQQDLVIYRRDYHPRFDVGGSTFFPVESVAAVIEVKSRLDSKAYKEALVNSASVKLLDRTAGRQNYLLLGGSGGMPHAELLDADRHEHQVFSVIVAADAISHNRLHPVHYNHFASHPRRAWPNMVVVAQKWSLVYAQADYPSGVRTNQMRGVNLQLMEANEHNVEPLVDMAQQLWSFLRVAPLIDVAPNHYVRGSLSVTRTYMLPPDDVTRLGDEVPETGS